MKKRDLLKKEILASWKFVLILFVTTNIPSVVYMLSRVNCGYYHYHPSQYMILFMGFIPVLIGVYMWKDDLSPGLRELWMSKPEKVARFAVSKYFIGLLSVLLVYCLPLIIEVVRGQAGQSAGFMLSSFTFVVIMSYNAAFVLSALCKKSLQAGFLAVLFLVALVGLPIVVSQLNFFNVYSIIEQNPIGIVTVSELTQGGPWYQNKLHLLAIPFSSDLAIQYNIDWLRYALISLATILPAIILPIVAIRKDFRFEIGKRKLFVLCFACCYAMLFLFVKQSGNNITPLSEIWIGDAKPTLAKPIEPYGPDTPTESAVDIICGRKKVYIFSGEIGSAYNACMQTMDIQTIEKKQGKWVKTKKGSVKGNYGVASLLGGLQDNKIAVSSDDNYIFCLDADYEMGRDYSNEYSSLYLSLVESDGDDYKFNRVFDLTGHHTNRQSYGVNIYTSGNQLLFWDKDGTFLVLDISTPTEPKIESKTSVKDTFSHYASHNPKTGVSTFTLGIPSLPGFGSISEKLKAYANLKSIGQLYGTDGDYLGDIARDHFRLMEPIKDGNKMISLEMKAYWQPNAIERMIDAYPRQLELVGEKAFALMDGGQYQAVNVFDIDKEAMKIRKTSHFVRANEKFFDIEKLPDGNIIVAGRAIYILSSQK